MQDMEILFRDVVELTIKKIAQELRSNGFVVEANSEGTVLNDLNNLMIGLKTRKDGFYFGFDIVAVREECILCLCAITDANGKALAIEENPLHNLTTAALEY